MSFNVAEPQTIDQIISWHSKEQQSEFDLWKKNLRQYQRGCVKLINNLEKAGKCENYLEYLAEFNIARLLRLRGIDFDYEKEGFEDFLIPSKNFEISVKSLMPKKYQIEEKNLLKKLYASSVAENIKKKTTIKYNFSEVYFEIEPNGSLSKMETLQPHKNGYILDTEMKQKSAIMGHIKKFDQKQSDKKKLLFFIVQNDDCPAILLDETILFYYKGLRPINEYDQTPYENQFGELRRDIAGFIFFHRPNEMLVWDTKSLTEKHRDIDRLNIFPSSKEIMQEINELFGINI